MAKSKEKVGTTVEVKDGCVVVRPDGSTHTITGTEYVLDVPGTHTVGDKEIEVS